MNVMSDGLSEYLDKLSGSTKIESKQNSVKIDSNDRDGHFLILTKIRGEKLEK